MHKQASGILAGLEKAPVVGPYAQARGRAFLLTWAQRLSGLLLTLYLFFHLYTLSGLKDPAAYQATMEAYGSGLFGFLEWLLALPVMFHALNGGRLIIYELFGFRNLRALYAWMWWLLVLYLGLLAFLMLEASQQLPALAYWLLVLAAGLTLAIGLWLKAAPAGHSRLWLLQRASGVFLLVVLPAHLLFMHTNPAMAKDAAMVLARLHSPLVVLVDMLLVLCICYHGAYGLASLLRDYMAPGPARAALLSAAWLLMALAAALGLDLLFSL